VCVCVCVCVSDIYLFDVDSSQYPRLASIIILVTALTCLYFSWTHPLSSRSSARISGGPTRTRYTILGVPTISGLLYELRCFETGNVVHLTNLRWSFVYPPNIHSRSHPFIHKYINPFMYLFSNSTIHSSTNILIHSCIYSVIQLSIHPQIY